MSDLALPGAVARRDPAQRRLAGHGGPAGNGSTVNHGAAGRDGTAGRNGMKGHGGTAHGTAGRTGTGHGSQAGRVRREPATVQAVALYSLPGTPPQGLSGAKVIAGTKGTLSHLLIPDPLPGMRRVLALWLEGRTAVLGPVVPVEDAVISLGWARKLLTMVPQGASGGIHFVDDHLATLLLFQDPLLAGRLSAKWLARLAELTPQQREWTEETLLAWLEGGGTLPAARLLRIHPQAVRNRLRSLEKIFGSGLRDPRARFELLLALKIQIMAAEYARLRRRAGMLSLLQTPVTQRNGRTAGR
ncbi:helix-turn-helix domain-containing protein [Kitasatospora sp. NPDC047058]|uniref:helix-turn-helix domain-containing protein n=1 Tax=Kitasatospora sp. NPDC047058 TaxID=3155620 RepID=UPI003401DAF4